MTEKQLLKKLDIPDWRHLSKDKVAVLANDFCKLDPEVAKSILAQFPKFSETALELVEQMQESFKLSTSSVKDIDTQVLQNIQSTIEWLRTELPNTSEELKPKIIDTIVKLIEEQRTITESHKKFHLDSLKSISQTVGIATIGLMTAIGGYFVINNSKQNTNDTDNNYVDIDE